MTSVVTLSGHLHHRRPPITVFSDATAREAATEMDRARVGCLLVLDRGSRRAVGIISERDIVRRTVAAATDPDQAHVAEIMTADLISGTPATTVQGAYELMARNNIRHLPILDDGRPVGLISSRDVLAQRLDVLELMKEGAESVARLTKSLKLLDLDEVLALITKEVYQIFGARRGVLCIGEDAPALVLDPMVCRRNCACPETDLLSRQDRQHVGAVWKPVYESVPPACRPYEASGPRVHIPLDIGEMGVDGSTGGRWGYLCACCCDQNVSDSNEAMTYICGLLREVMSASLINAMVFHQEARVDSLTVAATRQVFKERLRAEFIKATHRKQTFAVAMVDVDDLKRINDRWGHQVGDRVLQETAVALRNQARRADVIARYGGDEFALLLPDSTAQNAAKALERVRRRLAILVVPNCPSFTISCGVAEWAGDVEGDTEVALVGRADEALYTAKRAGRDRVAVFAQGESPVPQPSGAHAADP